MTLGRAIDEFLKSPSGSPLMRPVLSRFAVLSGRDCPMFILGTREAKEFIMEVKKAAERNDRSRILEEFFGFARERGWVNINPAVGIIKKKEPKTRPAPQPKSRMPAAVLLSEEGRQKIEAEMKELEEARQRVIREVAEAREDGDLRENAPYHAAREELARIEGRLRESRLLLLRAESA